MITDNLQVNHLLNGSARTRSTLTDREREMILILRNAAFFDRQVLQRKIFVVEEWDWRYRDAQLRDTAPVVALRGPDRLVQYIAAAAAALDGIDVADFRSDVEPRRRMRDWLIITKKVPRPWESRRSLLPSPAPSNVPQPPRELWHLLGSFGVGGPKARLRKVNRKEKMALIFMRELLRVRYELGQKGILTPEHYHTTQRRTDLWDWAINWYDGLLRFLQFQNGLKIEGYLNNPL
ncbi:uncharacterized protein Z519_00862 [Cladophialophora bantiana CBS 173.52]|uniref:Uncharacterized protein n=1 Tax=Cladophialophora bantiana (strain ATCC 10958 / CBS 173.52 / CDC B-1940 / NIH 8579) TaxID=1442370 RepID=A0A0D2IR34_CLAB1|nr:uncharacterized protein Z519_00862 [Cladophialophora bantiana CBS 173.52]KIW99199.1 hypothetical protein Z519_00862 [Cladophialophora bantiana CBS 173.52]